MYMDESHGRHVPVMNPPISVVLKDDPRDMLRNPYVAPERPVYSMEYLKLDTFKNILVFLYLENPKTCDVIYGIIIPFRMV